jgi:hypothetical protein
MPKSTVRANARTLLNPEHREALRLALLAVREELAVDTRTCVASVCDNSGQWLHVMQGPDDQGG